MLGGPCGPRPRLPSCAPAGIVIVSSTAAITTNRRIALSCRLARLSWPCSPLSPAAGRRRLGEERREVPEPGAVDALRQRLGHDRRVGLPAALHLVLGDVHGGARRRQERERRPALVHH